MNEDFNFENASKASGNVAGLCNWAESMAKYHNVAKVRARRTAPAAAAALALLLRLTLLLHALPRLTSSRPDLSLVHG